MFSNVLPNVLSPNVRWVNGGEYRPYPAYIGGAVENSVGGGLPVLIEGMQKEQK